MQVVHLHAHHICLCVVDLLVDASVLLLFAHGMLLCPRSLLLASPPPHRPGPRAGLLILEYLMRTLRFAPPVRRVRQEVKAAQAGQHGRGRLLARLRLGLSNVLSGWRLRMLLRILLVECLSRFKKSWIQGLRMMLLGHESFDLQKNQGAQAQQR